MTAAKERDEMVEQQIRRRGVNDPRVLAAIRAIPREEFVAPSRCERAYWDEPVSIGHGQTISQPYITALMAQSLELTGGETVLDVGSGSGYHAALLGLLAHRVVSIEIIPELAALAAANLARTGLDGNVEVFCGDGSRGWPQLAPFDAISVAAGAPEAPAALLDQLAEEGRLIIPVGSLEEQDLRLVKRRQGRFDTRIVTLCRFVPLRGGGGWR
jgi:protein-L-isoaspartate(D-aspartate) O-methyltransferase